MEKVSIIGSGYIGLVTGACLAKFGHKVIFNDIDAKMLENLKNGIVPIHEDGLDELINLALKNNLIETTTDKKYAVENSDIIIFCLPTPPKKDGNADLKFIREVSKEIGGIMNEYKIIINKSTAPVGTNKMIKEIISHFYESDFEVVSIPEFLQEGKAVETFLNADRQVLGFNNLQNTKLIERIKKLFGDFNSEMVITNTKTAEFSKYVCNAYLALNISYINSLTSICEKLGINILDVSQIMKLDKRIGKRAFLNPGPGFGGMCFPKDVLSIVGISDRFGYTNKLLEVVTKINNRQKENVYTKIVKTKNLNKNSKISIIGLSFKKNTSDVRESQAKSIIELLSKDGYSNIHAFDPLAMDNFKKFNLSIKYAKNLEDIFTDSECLVIMTEWDVFKEIDLNNLKNLMKSKNIIDTRNLLDMEEAKKLEFNYIGMGRK
ncbi:MAG: UDP-glucose dehydrogenase family protein [Candidatus Helarchaeota archaeon]